MVHVAGNGDADVCAPLLRGARAPGMAGGGSVI
jgi:hypothetical protein